MSDAIRVTSVTKRFKLPNIPKNATVKDFVIRTIRRAPGGPVVDALKNVSFSVERGSMLGVIGRNGSGKTTLMRIIAGILQPDEGRIVVDGTVAPLFALGTGFHPDLTGRESARIELLALGVSREAVAELMPRILTFSEIGEFADAPIRAYSAGMTMRLAFSVAMCVDPDVLLLDEVLAVGDESFARKCLAAIEDFRHRGKTIVLVTHDASKIEAWCDTALWLDRGDVAGYGDPRSVVAAYQALSTEVSPEAV
ncbi:MAG TPA: ABC transporter ATP-binding protein [Candidatus Baltobacteraceae bacterium]|jgi:ABC-type polysaccharide/polyol phosphate transport system ATPase subunit